MSKSLYVCITVCKCVSLSLCVSLSHCLYVCLTVYRYVSLSVYVSHCLYAYLTVCMHHCLLVCLTVFMCVSLFVWGVLQSIYWFAFLYVCVCMCVRVIELLNCIALRFSPKMLVFFAFRVFINHLCLKIRMKILKKFNKNLHRLQGRS